MRSYPQSLGWIVALIIFSAFLTNPNMIHAADDSTANVIITAVVPSQSIDPLLIFRQPTQSVLSNRVTATKQLSQSLTTGEFVKNYQAEADQTLALPSAYWQRDVLDALLSTARR